MKRQVGIVTLLGLAACAQPSRPDGESPPADVNPSDRVRHQGFRPNPNFHPAQERYGFIRSGLRQEGQVLVIEGDNRFVTSGGGGAYGITDDNQVAIVNEVLAQYPDEFDTIQIYTTFLDEAHVGFAYYQSIQNTVTGIGVATFNGRQGWGLPDEGRLSGFSNMNTMSQWGELPSLNRVEGYYHGVISHELSHRWLFHLTFKDGAGNENRSLLGRDEAHWSVLAQADGSVMDGNLWRDNADGTFANLGTDLGFAPLDLYAMGRRRADEIEDLWYLTEAFRGNEALNKTTPIALGETVRGNRIDLSIRQVIAQMGPRNPPAGGDDPYYRAVFVLVTRPGEAPAAYQDQLDVLKAVQADFPQTWRAWTGGGMCTKASERCPEPILGLGSTTINDGGDGRIAPGESFDLQLSVTNTGLGTAENARVTLAALDLTATVPSDAIGAPPIAQGGTSQLPSGFRITASATVACGTVLPLLATFQTQEGPSFQARLELPVGTFRYRYDPMDEAPDWTINPDGTDGATAGQWALGEPDFVSVVGIVLQPGADHSPGDSKLSFHTGPRLDGFFSRHDLDGGETTLQSPVFALRDSRAPELIFYGWHVAKDLSVNPATDLDAPLIVEVTNDAGETWVELGRVEENTKEWTRYRFPIKDKVTPTNRVQFRFRIADETETGTVEAGVDDLEIIDYVEACPIDEPPVPEMPKPTPKDEVEDGCGCRSGVASGGSAWWWGALLFLGLRRRR
ncbi:MAG: hypothetical protein IPG45_36845 [Deltaproteobacteria bacterium]|nr:hypothetical protein [Deltaproteobacteria bacterium]